MLTIFFNTSGNKPDTSFPTVMFAITRLMASARRSLYSELSSARSSKFSPEHREHQVDDREEKGREESGRY